MNFESFFTRLIFQQDLTFRFISEYYYSTCHLIWFEFLSNYIEDRKVVACWLMRTTPDRAVRVRVLFEDIVLCSWARHLTISVPFFPQMYK